MQTVLDSRVRNELPHPFGETLSREWPHRIGVKVALLQREVKELRRKPARQQIASNCSRVSVLLGGEDGCLESSGRPPSFDVAIDFRFELGRHIQLAFAEYPSHPQYQPLLLR